MGFQCVQTNRIGVHCAKINIDKSNIYLITWWNMPVISVKRDETIVVTLLHNV